MKLSLSNTTLSERVSYDWSPKGTVGGIALQSRVHAFAGE